MSFNCYILYHHYIICFSIIKIVSYAYNYYFTEAVMGNSLKVIELYFELC